MGTLPRADRASQGAKELPAVGCVVYPLVADLSDQACALMKVSRTSLHRRCGAVGIARADDLEPAQLPCDRVEAAVLVRDVGQQGVCPDRDTATAGVVAQSIVALDARDGPQNKREV